MYIGVTNELRERLYTHRNPDVLSKAFTAKYKCYYLIYWEQYSDIDTAIDREKQLKGWTRNKKDKLILDFNPTLKFLNDEIQD
ncbi:GIY-YIG nuclease family protein [Flavobacterium rivuli]|uniref:GIY-YIG nuclease family protein n=1 Tax=Flavobacterium rivuli TaxID=498301 RepID=UPI002934C065|nr:GIY-YIG nuclease family protein [Flavobacterium rivuli]